MTDIGSTEQSRARFFSNVLVDPCGCHLWTGSKYPGGYGRFNLGGERPLAHRVSFAWKNGPIPDGMCVCHRCDTPACVNPDHLFLGTPADNSRDMKEKGRAQRVCGEAHVRAKLKEPDVMEIRQSRLSIRKLAALYGVSKTTIEHARNGTNWAYLNRGERT